MRGFNSNGIGPTCRCLHSVLVGYGSMGNPDLPHIIFQTSFVVHGVYNDGEAMALVAKLQLELYYVE